MSSGEGNISLTGIGGSGAGVWIGQESLLSTTSGDVWIDGESASYDGILVNVGGVTTTTGSIAMLGVGAANGVNLASGSLATSGGAVSLSGFGGAGAGIRLTNAASIDAAAGEVDLSASNDGSSDALVLQGAVASTTGVNLRPYDVEDTILLGAGNGFSLTAAELALVNTPVLVIGSAGHAGQIRVIEALERDGDLTLQNEGGTGGISIEAAIALGQNTLALASGGDITQTAAGAITAHSLLAIAAGDVSLTAAPNNLAADSLAGSAGGDFAFQDIDDLAIGEVASVGFEPADAVGFTGLSATGIEAGGSVFVGTSSGNLTLGADVSGSSIDLVAAETFHNPAGHLLNASEGWRVWARTWEGEERGGLEGDGPFDIFGCAFGQECAGVGSGNQFIYQEQRLLQVPIAPETVIEWVDEDEIAQGGGSHDLLLAAMCPVGDLQDDLLRNEATSDDLGKEWLKSRHRMRLSNCIDSRSAPGCRF